MNTLKYLFIGYKGKLKEYSHPQHRPLIVRNPVIETDSSNALSEEFPQRIISAGSNVDMLMLESAYHRWGKFGSEGDLIEVIGIDVDGVNRYYLTNIFNLSPRKGITAVDIVIVLKGPLGFENIKLVAIKRKYNPCQGKLALVGGMVDVKGYVMDSPIQAAIRELKEEVGLRLNISENIDASPFPLNLEVSTQFDSDTIHGRMEYFGTFPTSDQENVASLGTKRVYQSSAFLVTLIIAKKCSKEMIGEWLKAKDDAKELVIADADDIEQGLDFGFRHHEQIFQKALAHLKK
jgi:8-oxo-dGTP pyrophosphatase MutT (NUDIX family)